MWSDWVHESVRVHIVLKYQTNLVVQINRSVVWAKYLVAACVFNKVNLRLFAVLFDEDSVAVAWTLLLLVDVGEVGFKVALVGRLKLDWQLVVAWESTLYSLKTKFIQAAR